MQREFKDINDEYYLPCRNGGRLQRIHYTSGTYDAKNQEIQKDAGDEAT